MRLLTLFLLFATTAIGQHKIEGIGKFKLKRTTIAYLDTLVKEKDFDRETIRSWDDYFKLKYKKKNLQKFFLIQSKLTILHHMHITVRIQEYFIFRKWKFQELN